MSENQTQLPLGTFWYFVVFAAGIYWGISFFSGAMTTKFMILVPPVGCLFTASAAVGGLNKRAILGAVTLYVNFLFSFAIGYGLASAGIIQFFYRSGTQ